MDGAKVHITAICATDLTPLQRRELQLFYRSQGDKLSLKPRDWLIWRRQNFNGLTQISAALRLQALDEACWQLRSLLVSRECRHQGLAHHLLQQIPLPIANQSIWLICQSSLATLYRPLDFQLLDRSLEETRAPEKLKRQCRRLDPTLEWRLMSRLER